MLNLSCKRQASKQINAYKCKRCSFRWVRQKLFWSFSVSSHSYAPTFFEWHPVSGGSHDSATSTPWTPFRALTITSTTFASFFIVNKILRFYGHMYDVWSSAKREFAIWESVQYQLLFQSSCRNIQGTNLLILNYPLACVLHRSDVWTLGL